MDCEERKEGIRFSIDQEWLEAVAGTRLFYPAAGRDTAVFIDAFSPFITDYLFNDLHYSSLTDARPVAPPRFTVTYEHAPSASLRDAQIDRHYWRNVEPSMLVQHLRSGDEAIVVRRRRGFGQYALQELAPRSVGVFVHRRDGMGDGGSNMWFLGNVKKRHEPLSDLWDKLSGRLADKAILISDGSLTRFKFIQAAVSGQRVPNQVHYFSGFLWRQVGVLEQPPYRNAVIWGLERPTAF